ncbi:MAG: hypothetical protein ACREMA_02960, partial [Longimicrobiales bacterium]
MSESGRSHHITRALLLLALAGCGSDSNDEVIQRRLIPVLVKERTTAGRLANQDAWSPCTAEASDTAVVARSHCQARSSSATNDARLKKRWSPRLAKRSAVTLRAEALFELKWHNKSKVSLQRAIALLEQARKLAPTDPLILNDLAVAYIELAQLIQQLDPMLLALDLVGRALAHDSTQLAARFNRALIMERLYLDASARDAWARYLKMDSGSKWSEDAHPHKRALAQVPDSIRWDLASLASATPEAVSNWVRRSPQMAHDTFYAAVLPEWGRALQLGREERANELLRLAERIARGFAAFDGEQSVPLALDAIQRRPGEARR